MRTRYVDVIFTSESVMTTDEMQNCVFYCNDQVIPELKLQVSELHRQKQELETVVKEQSSELAGELDFQTSASQ